MISTLYHRGPDDWGSWCDQTNSIGLAHSRLAIVDLSAAGHQPMLSATGRYVIVFNGEIYNHKALRAKLEQTREPINWRGQSDTETLLAALCAWGIEATLAKLVGMFAFALWDRDTRSLTLVRDRLGEKPLYYGWQDGIFLFGSELKAIRAHPAFAAEIDRNALSTFMRYGYIPSPQTIYSGIYKLLPGSMLSVQVGDTAERAPARYWSLLDVARGGALDPFIGTDVEAVQGLEARLKESIALQQISDVAVGAFLSGGIDSSMIVALMQSQSMLPVKTFTIGFNEYQYDEAKYARAVAQYLGTNHTELYITSEDALAIIPRLPMIYDEPFGDSSQIPTLLVSQLARGSVTVSLSGDGGDELFGGYNRYIWGRRLLKVPAPIRQGVSAALSRLSPERWDRIYSHVEFTIPVRFRVRMAGNKVHKLAQVMAARSSWELYEHLVSTWCDQEEVVLGDGDSRNFSRAWSSLSDSCNNELNMMAVDSLSYLPDDILCKIDRAAMAVSLETRVPFLDHRVVEYSWHLPPTMKIRKGQGKWILRKLLSKYLPKELSDRPKMGFGVPIDLWLRGPLRDWAEDMLSEDRLKREGFFNPYPIRKKWIEHLSGQHNWQQYIWNALMFQGWLAVQGKLR
jgi:asparagine synthase (glutamine-hydrolysing)